MAVKYRLSNETRTITITKAQVLERGFLTVTVAGLLGGTTTSGEVNRLLYDVSDTAILGTTGASSKVDLVNRINYVYYAGDSTALSTAAQQAKSGGNELISIADYAVENGYSSVTVTIANVELYDTSNGQVYLKLPRDVTKTIYNS
ncbi:hypothetical protein [Solibacillus sp. NPDC093137]|uniref:hypothetical protein n=1 Tax=Solibacillus sp. NPDC093137 TaxID=3390678 RepID=UPI003D0090EB